MTTTFGYDVGGKRGDREDEKEKRAFAEEDDLRGGVFAQRECFGFSHLAPSCFVG